MFTFDISKHTHMTHTQFEIGKSYTTRLITNSDIIISMIVIRRTEKTVTINYNGQIKNYKVSQFMGIETIYPEGKYSMAPSFKAN